MGILKKKRKLQQGGSIWGDPRYLVLNADIPMQMPTAGKSTAPRVSGSGSKKKDSGPDFEGYLPSDIDFYENKKQALKGAMLQLSADGKEETPEYEMIQREYYKLESVDSKKLKNMAAIYKTNQTQYISSARNAGDEPAIIDGKAIVQVLQGENQGKHAVVSTQELIKNANMYKIINGREVLNLRHNNPAFSGFTKAGELANILIARGYGSNLYNKEIDGALKNVGYEKKEGQFVTRNNEPLDIDNFVFDPTSGLITKSNVHGLNRVRENLLGYSQNTNLTSYLTSRAISNLHTTVSRGKVKVDLDDPESVSKLINRSIETELASKIKSAVIHDRAEHEKATGSARGDKQIPGNYFSDALLSVFQNKEHLELDYINKVSPETGSLMQILPGSYVQRADELFDMDKNYGTNTRTDESEDETDHNRRTLNNNKLLNDVIAGDSEIAFHNGRTLSEVVDDGKLFNAIISDTPDFHVVLAPTEMNEKGKRVVNYESKYMKEMLQATDAVFEKLYEEGITPEDMLTGGPELIKRVSKMSTEELRKITGGNLSAKPEVRIALAFKTAYEAEPDFYNEEGTEWSGWNLEGEEEDKLYEAIGQDGGWSNHAKENFVFVPISHSFWKRIFKKDAFENFFETSIARSKEPGWLRTTTLVSI
jgi:hypothetical protein